MMKDSMLDRIYEEGFGLDQMNDFIAHMVGQIAHRYPRMNLFEIGKLGSKNTRLEVHEI